MNIKRVLISQYLAALEMLKRTVDSCPDRVWADVEPKNKFWHIAYHAIFYTHLYLQHTEEDFIPWKGHREDLQFMGNLPGSSQDRPPVEQPFSKEELLEYLEYFREQVSTVVPALDLESGDSGFYWLPFNKLELQFYNIRHLQQHTGELCERLGSDVGINVNWVGRVPQ